MVTVLRRRDASSLDPWIALGSLLCGVFWALYGFVAIQDPFIYGPNTWSVLVGTVQLLCIWMFRGELKPDPLHAEEELEEVLVQDGKI